MKREIKVTFKTITPLWTGDAWRENEKIRPSSIMGSLRFWFEVICYFAEITGNSDYENGKLKKDNVNGETFKKKILSNGCDFDSIDKTLAELGISLPSRIFGCTGWKGWMRIKEISITSKNQEYKYYLGPLRLEDLKYEKNGGTRIPTWYFKEGFNGSFEVIFEIEENILDPVFYPLLVFMEKYGFWGGKWNLGYGRLKVEKLERKDGAEWKEVNDWRSEESNDWKNKEFKFSHFYKNPTTKFADKEFLEAKTTFNEIEQRNNKKIMYLENQVNNTTDIKEIIKQLIKMKAERRKYHKDNINDVNLRHALFGTTQGGTQGTKIIPWIYEDENDRDDNGHPKTKGGFVSIAGILNLGR